MGNINHINQYGKVYSALPFEKQQTFFRRRFLANRVDRYPHSRILEIGCGMAPFAGLFENFEHMTIVEPYGNFVAKARRLAAKNTNIKVLHGFLTDYAELLQKQHFDFIAASGLLHEVDDPEIFMAQIAAIAKNNTVVHVNVPNARSFHRLLALEMNLISDIYAPSPNQQNLRQRLYDMDSLSRVVKNAGFRILCKGFYAFKPFTHAQMADLMNLKFINHRMLEGIFNMSKYAPEIGSEMFVELQLPRRQKRAVKNSP